MITKSEIKTRIQNINRGLTGFEKGRIITKLFPDLSKMMIDEADAFLLGMYILPGTAQKAVFVGSPVKWNDNPTKNDEYIFQINRMIELKRMAEAYSLTTDEKYAHKVIDELLIWIESVRCPELKDENGNYLKENFDGIKAGAWRALEIGIRLYRTLPVILEQIIYSDYLDDKKLNIIIESIKEQMNVLYHISPLLWPKADHNHYLMEMLGLYTSSLLLPELDEDGKYSSFAEQQLYRCLDNQCTTEGAQIEGCPSYHNGAVYWFSLKCNADMRYKGKADLSFENMLWSMFHYSLFATRNFGTNIPWGDSSTAPTGTCALSSVGIYLATGNNSAMKNAVFYVGKAPVLNELKINLFRIIDLNKANSDLKDALENPEKPNLDNILFAKDVNQVFIKGGWDRDDFSFMSACRTPVQNKHAHIDPCSFDYSYLGSPLIVDPGVYSYEAGEMRYRFKTTLSHSTLSINKKDAWEYLGSWAYGEQQEGKIVSVDKVEDSICIVERHHNYKPAIHTRVFFIHENSIVILDIVENIQKEDKTYISFHIDSPRVIIHDRSYISSDKMSNSDIDIYSPESDELEVDRALVASGKECTRESTIARFVYTPKDTTIICPSLLVARAKDSDIKSSISYKKEGDEITILSKVGKKEYIDSFNL